MTIVLKKLSKTFHQRGVHTIVADKIDATFPRGKSVGILGKNGAGKSTLLRMIAGTIQPDSGRIERRGTVSWPVGFKGSFHGDLTGAENARFVARIYGVDSDELVDFVAEFTEMGRNLYLPFRTYSSGMRARLAFAVSMAMPFDMFLMDEVTAVGDAKFREKCEAYLQDRLGSSGALIVSHSLKMVSRLADSGAVLVDGKLEWYDDVRTALARHREVLGLDGTKP